MKPSSFLPSICTLSFLLFLSACGGGGNSTSSKKVEFDIKADKEMKAPALFKEYKKAKENDDVGTHTAPLKKYKGKKFIVTVEISDKLTHRFRFKVTRV
ncbi:MAG: hypothetical protein ABEH38_03290, partial [Flavobacteriales bacterium]